MASGRSSVLVKVKSDWYLMNYPADYNLPFSRWPLAGFAEESGESQSLKIDRLEEIIGSLPKEGSRGLSQDIPTKTDAEKVGDPVLLVNPKITQNSGETLNDIRNKIDPAKLAVGIEKMKPIKEEQFGKKYEVNLSEMKNPRAVIVGVEEEVLDRRNDEIVSILLSQNEFLDKKVDKITINKKYFVKSKNLQAKSESGNVIEIDPKIMNEIMNVEKMHVKYRNCGVFSYYNVLSKPKIRY
ncbi:hypothetical protein HHI36_013231 [Cryptolaemus montrouzieri]|uniref:Uncharacterized protein n=1 Tax=Cryptolaemus montrouzieri TaxID=559131 RepID=A0ABD2NGR2_9CUCU